MKNVQKINNSQELHEMVNKFKLEKETNNQNNNPFRFSSLPHVDEDNNKNDLGWVVIGAHRETWRYDRLAAAYRILLNDAMAAGMYEKIRINILSMYDYKGTLTVTWFDKPPTKEMMDLADMAWYKVDSSEPIHYYGKIPRTHFKETMYGYDKYYIRGAF
jgi:hypothetical protein